MNKKFFLPVLFLVLLLFLSLKSDTLAVCNGYDLCQEYDDVNGVCGPGYDLPVYCSGSTKSVCLNSGSPCQDCANSGPGCNFECGIGACGGGGACDADEVYIDMGGSGSTYCPDGPSGCYFTSACSLPPPDPTATPPPGGCFECNDASGTGWCELHSTCLGYPPCSVCPGATPATTPAPTDGTITGHTRCTAIGAYNIVDGVPVEVLDSGSNQLTRVVTANQAGYSASFTPVVGNLFAARVDGATPNWGSGGYTPSGSEAVCDGSGSLVQHEACPFEDVENTTVSGFDFTTDKAPLNPAVTPGATSVTFTWDEPPASASVANRYILRINHSLGSWPDVGPSGCDYWIPVPYDSNGNPTVGTCNGSTCTVTLDETTTFQHPLCTGSYDWWTVQLIYDGVVHCQLPQPAFEVGSSCEIEAHNITLTGPGDLGNDTTVIIDETPAGAIYQVQYTLANPSIASFTLPNPDPDDPFMIGVQGLVSGTTSYTATGSVTGNTCTDTATITVGTGAPWLQGIGADITSAAGNIDVDVPTGTACTSPPCFFIGDNLAGYPGVAIADGNVVSPPDSSISSTNWNAEGSSYAGFIPDFDYYRGKMPSSVVAVNPSSLDTNGLITGGVDVGGYRVILVEYTNPAATLTLDDASAANIDLVNNKVILLVKGVVRINKNIKINDGVGFFAVIASNNIIVSDTVGHDPFAVDEPDLEGVYKTDLNFVTYPTGTSQLKVRGSVVANTLNLRRSLPDNSLPAEVFEYGEDIIANFPPFLGSSEITWREGAP
jgi:hypothetical protein